MRNWIVNRVKGLDGIPNAFGEGADRRVIGSGKIGMTSKPFLLVSMGVESPPLGSTPEMRAQSVPFTVQVHDEPGSFSNVDDAVIALKNELPTLDGFVIGNLSVYEIRWLDIGQDAYDDYFKTDFRPVRFAAMTRSGG